jgi:hypothetical protein
MQKVSTDVLFVNKVRLTVETFVKPCHKFVQPASEERMREMVCLWCTVQLFETKILHYVSESPMLCCAVDRLYAAQSHHRYEHRDNSRVPPTPSLPQKKEENSSDCPVSPAFHVSHHVELRQLCPFCSCALDHITLRTSELYSVQGDQKVYLHLMITIKKVASNVQTVPRQSPDIY